MSQTVNDLEIPSEQPRDAVSENAWLREVARALRSIRCGSIELTVHDGHVVELHKTERIRKSSS